MSTKWMKNKVIKFLVCLAITWLFIAPVLIVMAYSIGWQRGYQTCSEVWNENVDNHLERLKK